MGGASGILCALVDYLSIFLNWCGAKHMQGRCMVLLQDSAQYSICFVNYLIDIVQNICTEGGWC